MDLKEFSKPDNFLPALKSFFKDDLNVPINYIADEPTTAEKILDFTYKDNDTFKLIHEVYFVGMIDDAAFQGDKSISTEDIKSDYDGVLVFGLTLNHRKNNLLPTRSQLAEISRAFNREFFYTPVVLIFKYQNNENDYLAFANTERLKYKQAWREGEKAGKVSLLRDINTTQTHSGHLRILEELRIPTTGKKKVESFSGLYKYWQDVFSVSLLSKKFYQELSNWYFWAIKHVTFPNKPNEETVVAKYRKYDQKKLDELINEHNATNVIRLLTRLLFVWFMKEKKLIPEELFDLKALQQEILKQISPERIGGLFPEANLDSIYYKAILQNLFFASLNCPIEEDNLDKRKRGFRGDGYGTHRGIDYLMRYKKHFKNPDSFLELMNAVVPFLNGGLFECLDDKYQNLYIDGFSDQMTKGEQLVVPDYLFFGVSEKIDLSQEYGKKTKQYKEAGVKGLINILKSYKFTITENTPIEEDVALDPELLGKVFENLLASYNPETKTTARKQTGSFYTPREIVNYMVDESLIAYLKNKILEDKDDAFRDFGAAQYNLFGNDGKTGQLSLQEKENAEFSGKEEQLDKLLHELVSFDPGNPFQDYPKASKAIVEALDQCKILDPACGSGAFPMGILQKMVHVLQKLDPKNEYWKEVQLNKAIQATEEAYNIADKDERETRILEIHNAFDDRINDPDYARKLYLIENCIYGVDIQPIATQISKLRFFISLVVDQKVNPDKPNFGIRPLPNLETKFVAANTLIGIEKPKSQYNLFETGNVKALEKELKRVRHKLFSARTKDTKLKYRQKDEELRHAIADELKENGWQNDTADNLAKWDPYDQNASSTFFDPEWMFDVKKGFDVVIGNPPYVRPRSEDNITLSYFKKNYECAHNQLDLFHLFIEFAIKSINSKGVNSFIISNAFLANENTEKLRKFILINSQITKILDFKEQVFEGASVDTVVYVAMRKSNNSTGLTDYVLANQENGFTTKHKFNQENFKSIPRSNFTISLSPKLQDVFNAVGETDKRVDTFFDVTTGIKEYQIGKGTPPQTSLDKENRVFNANEKIDETYLPELRGKNLRSFEIQWNGEHIKYGPWLAEPRSEYYFKGNKILIRKIPSKKRLVLSFHENDMIVDQSIYVGKKKNKSDIDEYYAIGVLSSSLMFWYFKIFNNETDDLFPQIKTKQFKELPLKCNNDYLFPVSCISKFLHYYKMSNSFLKVLDALIIQLYFPDHLKERNIDVLDFVEQDIQDILKNLDFEDLSDAEKENVIKQLHTTWTDPNNEVVKRMAQFKDKSPDILKPILES